MELTEGRMAEIIAFTVMYAITMLLSLAGNILLIYIVWKKPDARSLTSFMFVNMAVADLLVTLFVIPYSVMDLYTAWPITMSGLLGNIVCKTVIYIAYFTMTTSFLCLTFMALDRFYAVVYPLQRLLWFRRPKVLIPIVWILPMALMSIVPVYIAFFPDYSRCGIEILGGDLKKFLSGIYSYFFTVHYLLPLSVNTTLYTITAVKLWFHAVPGDTLAKNPQQQQLTKRKVVRMLIIVSTTFAVCWLPGQVYHLYIAITGTANEFAGHICFWFGYNNSAINPWLYIGLNSKMYSAFSRMTGRKARSGKNGLKRDSTEVTRTQDTRV